MCYVDVKFNVMNCHIYTQEQLPFKGFKYMLCLGNWATFFISFDSLYILYFPVEMGLGAHKISPCIFIFSFRNGLWGSQNQSSTFDFKIIFT